MIDKERWNIRTDNGQMEKLIRYNMTVHYEKHILKKSFSSKVKQSTVFFLYEW